MEFHTTRWDLVLEAGGAEHDAVSAALTSILDSYWRPLYLYARLRGLAHHDAQDGVQAFYLALIAKQSLRHANRERGRFRTFLLCAFQNFLGTASKREHRIKRGGEYVFVDLESASEEELERSVATGGLNPERAFDREWATALLARATARLAAARKTKDAGEFERLRPFLSRDGADSSRAEAALALGITINAIKVRVHRLRTEFRQILREEVAATVTEPHEIEQELKYLREILT